MSQLTENRSQPDSGEELNIFCVGLRPRGFKKMAGKSLVTGDRHAGFCEGLGVRLPRAARLFTRLDSTFQT